MPDDTRERLIALEARIDTTFEHINDKLDRNEQVIRKLDERIQELSQKFLAVYHQGVGAKWALGIVCAMIGAAVGVLAKIIWGK